MCVGSSRKYRFCASSAKGNCSEDGNRSDSLTVAMKTIRFRFQCVTGKFFPFRILMRIGSVFFGGFNEKIGIDRSAVVMDTLIITVEFPILRIITIDIR